MPSTQSPPHALAETGGPEQKQWQGFTVALGDESSLPAPQVYTLKQSLLISVAKPRVLARNASHGKKCALGSQRGLLFDTS